MGIPDIFIQQAREFKQLDYEGLNKLIKLISIADSSHPWTVMRAAELLNWINNGDYERFISSGFKQISFGKKKSLEIKFGEPYIEE